MEDRGELFDILNRLSPEEIVVLIYHKVLDVSLEELPGHRHRFKVSCLDAHKCLNKIYAKRRIILNQDEKIAAFQELFTYRVDSLF